MRGRTVRAAPASAAAPTPTMVRRQTRALLAAEVFRWVAADEIHRHTSTRHCSKLALLHLVRGTSRPWRHGDRRPSRRPSRLPSRSRCGSRRPRWWRWSRGCAGCAGAASSCCVPTLGGSAPPRTPATQGSNPGLAAFAYSQGTHMPKHSSASRQACCSHVRARLGQVRLARVRPAAEEDAAAAAAP